MSNSSETSKLFLVRRLLERIPVYKRVLATILDVASASFDSLRHANFHNGDRKPEIPNYKTSVEDFSIKKQNLSH